MVATNKISHDKLGILRDPVFWDDSEAGASEEAGAQAVGAPGFGTLAILKGGAELCRVRKARLNGIERPR
jgi:hypothetical protein